MISLSTPPRQRSISTFGPRSVQATPKGLACRILLWIAFPLSILIGLTLGMIESSELRELQNHGVAVDARIVARDVTHSRKPKYTIHYEYRLGGETVRDRESVDWDGFYNANEIGQPISVVALPEHPKVHRVGMVDEARIKDVQLLWIVWTTIVSLMAAGLLFLFEREYQRQRLALRDRTSGPATVIEVRPPAAGRLWEIRFVYETPQGMTMQGAQSTCFFQPALHRQGMTDMALFSANHQVPPRLLSTNWMVRVEP